MKLRGWMVWGCACIAWALILPAVFGVWLSGEVDAQYASGVRTSADGDSLSLPVAGFAVLNFALVAAVNFALGIYLLCRRYLTRGSSRPLSAAAEP